MEKTPRLSLEKNETPGASGVRFEAEGYARGFQWIAGVDEVGRGPLAGPVVAAAVMFQPGVYLPEIKDSKALTARKRQELAQWIKQHAHVWAVGLAEAREIDELNILRASLLAMSRAVRSLSQRPDFVLIDGPYTIPLDRFVTEGGTLDGAPRQRAIKKGDQLCFSIAAASIVAKVERDQIMLEADGLYPDYGFAKHKGYRSALHFEALQRYGPSPIHRLSFKPVAESVQPAGDSLLMGEGTDGEP